MKTLSVFISILLLFFSCGIPKKKEEKPRTKEILDNFYDQTGELDSIKQIIFNLPMVKALNYKPTLLSPRMTIDPNDSIHYQIGDNSGGRFRPELNFFYYRKNKQLKYLDTMKDSLILIQ